MIAAGSAVWWFLPETPNKLIWKAKGQFCLQSFPGETLWGELISVTVLRRSPIEQEPLVPDSCGAGVQGHGHPGVKTVLGVEVSAAHWTLVQFLQDLEHNPDSYSLRRCNQAPGGSPQGL